MLIKWLSPIPLLLAALCTPVQASTQAQQNDTHASAIQELRTQAKAGQPDAQRKLALAYLEGQGVTKDTARAYELFVEAARQQDAEAQYHLGRAYFNGKGTDRNLISAYIWLSASASKSSPLQDEASSLRSEVATQLTETQREKAELLVQQLQELYLP